MRDCIVSSLDFEVCDLKKVLDLANGFALEKGWTSGQIGLGSGPRAQFGSNRGSRMGI